MKRLLLALAALSLVAVIPSAARAQDLYDLGTIRTIELTFTQTNWWAQLTNNYGTGRSIKADLTVDGTVYPDVGVRFRGQSRYYALPTGSLKKPFGIALDEYVPNQEVMGYKTLNLNNNLIDPSFVREALSYDILRNYMPAPGCSYVWLKLNGEDWGLYLNTQQINKDLIKAWFPSKDGNRYKGEFGATFEYLGSNPQSYRNSYQLKTENTPNPWVKIARACRVLNNTPAAQMLTELPKEMDVDNVLWYLAASNTLLFLDSYVGPCHNFFIYHDIYHDRLSVIPWDQNSAFAGYPPSGTTTTTLYTVSPYYILAGAQRPLMTQTIANRRWKTRYDHHMRTIVDEHCNWANLSQRIEDLQAFIADRVESDPNALYTFQQFKSNVTQSIQTSFLGGRTVPGLKPTIEGREAVLKAHPTIGATAPTISDLAHAPSRPLPGQSTFVIATIGGTVGVDSPTVYYRVKGWFRTLPMFDNGMNGDGQAGDGVYGATLPGQEAGTEVDYYVGVNAAQPPGAVAFAPTSASHQSPSYVVAPRNLIMVNELLADNDSGDVDENGEFEDWVEIHNSGLADYDLSGHYLSDDLLKPTKWEFPTGTMVSSGGFVRVWCDEQPTQGLLHANFKLSKAGETVGLFDSNANGNVPLDVVVFGQQKGDRSFGRVPDANDHWFYIYQPSGNATLLAPGREAVRFDARRTGSPLDFDLKFSGGVQAGQMASFDFTGGPPLSPAFMVLGVAPTYLPIPPFGPLAVHLAGAAVVPMTLNANGDASVSLTVPAAIQGLTVYSQGVAVDFSNALTVGF